MVIDVGGIVHTLGGACRGYSWFCMKPIQKKKTCFDPIILPPGSHQLAGGCLFGVFVVVYLFLVLVYLLFLLVYCSIWFSFSELVFSWFSFRLLQFCCANYTTNVQIAIKLCNHADKLSTESKV